MSKLKRNKRSSSHALQSCVLEALENRQLFSLVGVLDALGSSPQLVSVGTGSMVYVAGSPNGTMTVSTSLGDDIIGAPTGFSFSTLNITQTIASGTGAAGPGTFTITNGSTILLSGVTDPSANQGGFGFDTTDSEFDFQFAITGGTLTSYLGSDLGVQFDTDPTGGFAGFATGFNRTVKGILVGTLPGTGSGRPNIVTTPGPTVVIGSGQKLTDTAVLTGTSNSPAGTVTFYLFAQGVTPNATFSNAVYSDTVAAPVDGTYSTATGSNPGGYLPLTTGTYQWLVVYSKSGSPTTDITASEGIPNEPEVVQPKQPNIVTTPSATPGTGVSAGQFATIGFWHNMNGQAVINSFNGSSSSTALGNWLATTFPHLFGATNPYGGINLAGKTNAQVAATYLGLWTPSGLNKNTYVQAFAVALGLYADTTGLGGASLIANGLANQFGFVVTPGGAGTFNVGNNGAAFGVANGSTINVTQILQFVDANFVPATGLFFGGDQTKTSAANNVLNGINTQGDIPGNGSLTMSGMKLNDSATLSGGFNPTGSITFYLLPPGSTAATPLSAAVYTDTVTVTGNGTYTTANGNNPGGFAVTVPGTYQWVAVYSGDVNNSQFISAFGLEPWTVGTPPLTINTIDGGTVAFGSPLTDKADIEGGNNPVGNVVFRLYAPGDTTYSNPIYTSGAISVNGAGVYGSPATVSFTPTVPGTYQWVATFTSSNPSVNPSISSPQGEEPETVLPPTPGCITGKKYIDVCGDDCSTTIGIGDDQAYKNMPPITIQLYQGTTLVATTQTDANGVYTFTNVAPGTYTVKEVVPTGWVLTAQSSGPINLTAGSTSSGNNFADFKLICISGTKYNDCTGNGFSNDDTGLAGVTIRLFKNGGTTPIATTVTGADGSYVFKDLGPGNYFVQEAPVPTGWTQTGGNSGYTVKATSGNNDTCNDFDDYHTVCVVTSWCYEINGCKFVNDISGQLHQGDVVKVVFTIAGPGTVSFVSYTAPDAYFDANHASQQKLFDVATGTYTAAGTYCLTIVVPCCDYQVDFICGLPIDTLGPAGSNIFYTPQNRLHDSDNGGTTSCIPTTTSCNGYGSITGCVFSDHNNDGYKGSSDEGLCNVQVTCYGTTNDGKCVLVDCTTDQYGNYKFGNLPAGCYKIIEHDPDNCYDGSQNLGSCGGSINDDICSNIVISGSKCGSGYNFCELVGSSLSGTVFVDKDKDGKIDYNEVGLANVKIVLTGVNYLNQSVTMTTYTDAKGNYTFDNLQAGKYTITEVQPTGYTTTKDVVGTDGGTLGADKVSNINVSWDSDGTGYNFGEVKV